MIVGGEGWYVVGGGRNGAELDVLLIAMRMTIMFSDRLARLRR